jgi:hypothetical protein
MADYDPYRMRKRNRWQGFLVTLIVAGIGLPIAGWLIYITFEEQSTVKKNAPEKPLKNNPPPTATLPEKNSAPKTQPPANPLPKDLRQGVSKSPADTPAENAKIGKQLCFLKGNWSEGLPKLAASADERLKSLAQKELAAPESVANRLAVADGWWKVSEQYAPPADKEIRRHAVEWYKKVVGDLEDTDHDRAEFRIYLETPNKPGEKRTVNPEELE